MVANEIVYDFSNLKELIKSRDTSIKELAKNVNMSRTSLSLKLNNNANFTQQEIRNICEKLAINDEEMIKYFFTPFARKTVRNMKSKPGREVS